MAQNDAILFLKKNFQNDLTHLTHMHPPSSRPFDAIRLRRHPASFSLARSHGDHFDPRCPSEDPVC